MERFVNTLSWVSLFMSAIVLCCASAKGMDIPVLFVLSIQASILMICETANFIIEDEQEKNRRIIDSVNKLLDKAGSHCRFSFSHKWKVKI